MSNGVRVDKTRLNLGGLETFSEFKYSDGDWLLSDRVGDALHTISYSYNGRGWLEKLNSVSPPPPGILDDCDPDENPIPPTQHPQCFEIDDIIKILYNCDDLNPGDSTTVIVSVQSGMTNTTSPIGLNGSDGSETVLSIPG